MKKAQKVQAPLRINSEEELDNRLKQNNGNPLHCFVQLNFGFRSSKDISFNENGDYFICNLIDDSEEIIKHKDLIKSFIGQAISKGALYECK